MTDIQTQCAGGILHIIFSRPTKKNALTEEMYGALNEALQKAIDSEDIKVMIFSGEGGSFTAGNDLDDFLIHPPQDATAPVFQFFAKLSSLAVPVIAAVEGVAVGLGTTMLLHCDLVYASEDAKFVLPFVSLGLVPEGGSSFLLSRLAGHQKASEMLLFGQPFGAEDALKLGFVNQVLPAGEVLQKAIAQADRLISLPTAAVRATKRLLRGRQKQGELSSEDRQLAAQMSEEITLFCDYLARPAFREAIAAFKEKRKPNFSNVQ